MSVVDFASKWTSYWDLSQILTTTAPPYFATVTDYWDAGNVTDGNWACEPCPCSDKDKHWYIILKAAPLQKAQDKCSNVHQQRCRNLKRKGNSKTLLQVAKEWKQKQDFTSQELKKPLLQKAMKQRITFLPALLGVVYRQQKELECLGDK